LLLPVSSAAASAAAAAAAAMGLLGLARAPHFVLAFEAFDVLRCCCCYSAQLCTAVLLRSTYSGVRGVAAACLSLRPHRTLVLGLCCCCCCCCSDAWLALREGRLTGSALCNVLDWFYFPGRPSSRGKQSDAVRLWQQKLKLAPPTIGEMCARSVRDVHKVCARCAQGLCFAVSWYGFCYMVSVLYALPVRM
jgi:hypothetical protein